MTAYVISESEVLDEELAASYRTLAAAAIRHHGGRYVVRGAEPEAADGLWPAGRRLVVVEFADMDRLKAWYASPEYAEARELAKKALKRRLLFVEGTPEQGPRGGECPCGS
ncbi:DUF1330 domain-containing protein [Streptomyces olivoreticuli]|uniref:DUF1330 domain-containing protein n=1 Tax=Streptomyces olivoreticuli TaxID=68246 RepID=UPI002657E15C|nr:DUF1330 domain-containing protein [Streptomyces olivoreticuli]WKK23109.1 DUF1330 domain-containing protein [Streptomyces olivoreticuli]